MVFHKPLYCPDSRRSGRFPWRLLYNNGQFPEAEVRAGCDTGGSNERKDCFGSAGSHILLLGKLLDSKAMVAGGRGSGASELSG
jgi:hypothetical protein